MNKNILITGTNRGLGLGFCKHYLEQGHQVFALSRSPSAELKSLSADFPKTLHLVVIDILSPTSVQSAFEQVRQKTDKLDILINNAGRYGNNGTLAENIDSEDLLLTYQTNVIGPLLVTKAFLPLVETGSDKKVIHISTLMASIADNTSSGSYGYRMSKAALNMLNKNLSIDIKEKGILSVALHPGWVQTDMGGPNAPLTVDTSIEGMTKVIGSVQMKDTGTFLDYRGKSLAY